MDLPCVTLHDVGFDCDIDNENFMISTPSSNETLIINQRSVYWYKGNIISRKLIYDSDVTNAFFTSFNESNDEKILIVILVDSTYIYYRDGRSYVSSFPFKIKKALQYENGVIIEKDSTTDNVQFLTITQPMNELGSIVSSSTSSISPKESLIYFPENSNTSIAVTLNETENSIILYHTRFLNRTNNNNNKTLANGSANRKQSIHNRRTSLAANNSTGSYGGKEDIVEEDKIENKRTGSHSEVMSIDRMASYDFNSNKYSQSTSSSLDSSNLRKDATLTKFENIKLNHQNYLNDIKISSLASGNKEAIILKNSNSNLFEILIFTKAGIGRFNAPQFSASYDIDDKFLDFSICPALPGFMLMLSKDNKLVLYNPFNGISSSVYQPNDKVIQIYDNDQSQLIVRNQFNQIQRYQLIINPRSEAVEKLLSSFKLLVGSHTYDYIRLIWYNAFSIIHKDWEAFVLTILVIILPFAVEPSSINDRNLISSLLAYVSDLQVRALEDDFQLHVMAPNFVLALHLIREEYKLNVLQSKIVDDLGLLLAQITSWMSWGEGWYTYYGFKSEDLNNEIKFPTLQILETPPNIIQSLCSLFESNIVPYCTFSRLTSESEKIDELITPRSFYVLRLFEAIVNNEFSSSDVVNMVTEFNITQSKLETYPIGIIIPIKEAISFVEKNLVSLNQDPEKFGLVDRKDLQKLSSNDIIITHNSTSGPVQKNQAKDIHQIINSIHDPPDSLAPLETDRFNITKLIFSEDRRFYEISKILQTFQNQPFFTEDLSSLPEEEALTKQKEFASLVALRTLSIPLGRSMIFYSSKVPLATERFPDPKLNFNTLIQPNNVTVSLEKSSINANTLQWGYFHNGASNALTISKDSKGISGSWIIFNKPENLTAQHGGFLLGLGLNGHLKNLEEWNIYNYLGPKHLFTSIGLLLGMSASLRGTMDVKLTKVLSVHVVALLPHGASDLIIATQVQTAGLIGIGLLYLETQHRRMSEILLLQINANIIFEEKELSDESYRLAAGIALGYVNLGKGSRGDDSRGLHDTHAVDKLISIATIMKDVQTEEGYDKSMGGAIIALSFIYLKTNNDIIAKKLEIPENQHLLDYIRPDLLLLRSLGKNLILWDSIDNSIEWIESQIPTSLRTYSGTEEGIFNANYYYVLSGACLSMGLKYASSQDVEAKNTIIKHYDQVTDLLQSTENSSSYSSRLIDQYLSRCQTLLAVSASLIVAGSGDLDVFRRLRILHGKLDPSYKSEIYGKSMSVNMALGFLFLGGGQYTFNTSSNFAIASLVTSLYPLFPRIESIEPDVHLQALRHFWSLSVEPRCLVVRDVETNKPIKSTVVIDFIDGQSEIIKAPCLLPPINTIKRIISETEEYFTLEIDDLSNFKNGYNLYIYKRKRVEVLRKSVKLIISEINSKFEEDSMNKADAVIDLELFQDMKKIDVLKLLKDEPNNGFKPNIIDREIELNTIVKSPSNVSELWNLKLIFAFYDRLLIEEDAYYLTLEYVDDLKNKLMILSKSLHQ